MRAAGKPFAIRHMPGFPVIAMVCFFALYLPLAPLVIYSFNAGNSIALWEGLSLRWYVAAWENELVKEAAIRSLIVASCASLFATILATLAALGTTRTRPYRG
ncbi:MAG: spermidine/putrescine ABC transporter permease PotC, partial [Gammaproteobacteria bacterium]|nr:spermidine/putrescine ABC transporter permease PotC [Gammaproteobacteria bacterium]